MSTQTPQETTSPPAAWYPDTNQPGFDRWFDGTQWTDQTRSAGPAAQPAPPAPPAPLAEPSDGTKPKKKKKKKKGLIIAGSVLAATLAITGISSAVNASSDPAASSSVSTSQVAEVEEVAAPVMVTVPADLVGTPLTDAVAALEALGLEVTDDGDGLEGAKVLAVAESGEVEEGSTITLTVEKKPVLTLAQENALKSAESYVDLMGFSRQGLIDQLSSEYGSGYDVETATWAADAVGADWNAEAAEAAKSYLDTMAFSRDGLYEQLTSEYGGQFTPEQANAGLAAVGY